MRLTPAYLSARDAGIFQKHGLETVKYVVSSVPEEREYLVDGLAPTSGLVIFVHYHIVSEGDLRKAAFKLSSINLATKLQ
jgi:hypothetical protein